MAYTYREHSSRHERGRRASYEEREECSRHRRSSQAPSTHRHGDHYHRTPSHNVPIYAEPDSCYYSHNAPNSSVYQYSALQTAHFSYAQTNRASDSQRPCINPSPPGHGEGTSRARRSLDRFEAAEAQSRDSSRRIRHEDDYSREHRPYIAPFLPEHMSGILEARQELNNAQAQEQRWGNRSYTFEDNCQKRSGYDQNGTTYPSCAYDQYQYQQDVAGTPSHSQRRQTVHEQPERWQREFYESDNTKISTPLKQKDDHKLEDSEFDLVYDTENRSLHVNPNPRRCG